MDPPHFSGENPGEGSYQLRIPLAHGTRGFLNAQAFLFDPGSPSWFTASNAISTRIPW